VGIGHTRVVDHEGSTVLVCLNGLRMLTFRTPKVQEGDFQS
jgi:hypothetical protein